MTDWFAVTETTTSLGAGLDLEMPGPARGLGSAVVTAIEKGDLDESDLDAAVGRLLGGLDRIGALDGPAPEPDPKAPTPADVDLLRRAAAESAVLLSNDGVLPLSLAAPSRIALLGPPCGHADHHGRRFRPGDTAPCGQHRGHAVACAAGPTTRSCTSGGARSRCPRPWWAVRSSGRPTASGPSASPVSS